MRVLIVDDERKFCHLVAEFLTARGYEVAMAFSAGEAFAKMEAVHPEVVLLDVVMPGLSGLDAIKQLQARPAAPRIIMVTSAETDAAIDQARHSGAEAYLCKPIDLNHLERVIAKRDGR